ncbi:MAG: PBP1A family penicillin-binding protein [Desulfovibrionaceae bacterium]|nr:PBP1A family penicillin-binding protein [Desulfovibrionaceae bacterium]
MKLSFPSDADEPRPERAGQSDAPAGTPSEPEQPQKKPETRKRKRSLFGALVRWFFGIVIAVGVIGAAAGYFLYNWVSQDLPDLDRITEFKAPQATTILARDGSVLGMLYHEKRFLITLDDMPKYLPMAFLAIEDSSFYQHPGINPLAILRAFLVNFERGTKSQGGSTITQQLVKQLLLSSERSYMRKMKEAILATRLEEQLSKDQILALYLNYIFLGQHSYGVEAAARTYFGKNAANITLAEAALIAGMPQAPSRYNPFRNPETAKARQMEVLGRLRTLEWITEAEYQQAAAEPLVYWSMPDNVTGAGQWYFEEARRLLIEFFNDGTLKALGIRTNRVGEDFVYEAGLTVQTAMDPLQQELAGAALRSGLESIDKRQGWRGAVRHLDSRAEQTAFLEKKNFTPDDLLGEQWTQALVTSVTAREISVALGGGYVGTIPQAGFSWARHRSSLAPQTRSKAIVVPGDVIWVNQPPVKEQPAAKKKRGKAAAEPEAPAAQAATPVPGVPIVLALQQEPLVQGALASVEPQTGDVVALIGGYQFGNSHFNRATQSRRQPGSSFKPVIYSTALDNGFTPTSPVLDAPFEYVIPGTGEVWRPSNFEKNFRGELPLHQALALSRNTPSVRITQAVGVEKVVERAKILGLEPDFPAVLSLSLGSVGVSPLNITQAYAAFANGGLGVRPRIITSITDARGRVLYRQDIEHWQAISPQNAYQMDVLLKRVVNSGTGTRARIEGLNIAGKTGTSNDSRDVWFVGFTPYLCTGVYVGYDSNVSLGRQEQGGRTAAPIFRAYRVKADEAYKDMPQDFIQPPGIVMIDGLPYQTDQTGPGRSAMDGAVPDAENLPEDTGEDSEFLLQQMF